MLAVDWLQNRTEVPISNEIVLDFNSKADGDHNGIEGNRINGKMNVKNYTRTASPGKTL